MRAMLNCTRPAIAIGVIIACTAGWAGADGALKIPSPKPWNERPAIASAADGTIWLAWAAFEDDDDDILVARVTGGQPAAPAVLGSTTRADFSPRICVDARGGVHVVWIGERGLAFRVLHSRFAEGVWSDEVVISEGLAKCLNPAIAASPDGRVHVAWEAVADGNSDIYRAIWQDGAWSEFRRLTSATDADCNPALAATADSQVHIAWDRCEDAGYRVHFASLERDGLSGEQTVDFGQGHFRHPELAASGDRVWLSCVGFRPRGEARAAAWLHLDKWYCYLPVSQLVRAWDGSRWIRAPADPENVFGMDLLPVVDDDGDLWVFYEIPTEKKFKPRAKVLSGGEWRASLEVSGDLLSWEHRPAACAIAGATWAAFPSNTRGGSGRYAFTIEPGESDIYLVQLEKPTGPAPAVEHGFPAPSQLSRDPDPPVKAIEYGGQRLNLYFGDLHKHSDISGCGRLDGTTHDNYRFWRDWRRLDFMMNADHSEHHDDYDWTKVRRAAALFTYHGHFTAFSGYEWTSEFQTLGNLRCGHYNPTFLRDGDNLPCLSASKIESNDPEKLWSCLAASLLPGDDVITVCHHSGRENAPLQWDYYDPLYATHIEIVQSRGSYEHWNCPDPQQRHGDTTRARGHFAQDGLARGYRYGFTGGGDHSGRALTGVFAPECGRSEIFHALKSKHCYATNGERIFLDFRVDGRLMGSDFRSFSGAHEILVHAAAPSRITRIDLWRDGQIVKSAAPGRREWRGRWEDDSGKFRRTYYYVRVMTEAGGMAWASPVWITHRRAAGSVRVYIDSKQAEVAAPTLPCELPVVLRNDGREEETVTLAFDLPKGWNFEAKPSATATIDAGGWAELKAVITPAPPPDGEARLETVRARLEPGGSSLDRCEIVVLNTASGIGAAPRARELCDALFRLPAQRRNQHLREQAWLGDSVRRFAHTSIVDWQLSRPVLEGDMTAVDEAVADAGADFARLPDLDWHPRGGQLYLDDDGRLGYSVALVNVRSEGEARVGHSYCLTYVRSPDDREARLKIGADGRYRVWINGAVVDDLGSPSGAKRSGHEATVHLQPGWNQLVLKIERGRKFARFWAKLLAPQGDPFGDLEFSVHPSD